MRNGNQFVVHKQIEPFDLDLGNYGVPEHNY